MHNDTMAIKTVLQAYILSGDTSDDAFNRMAMQCFRHQMTYNTVYRQYCRTQGKTLRTVKHWHDLPAVPINAFKEATLSCIAPEDAARVFMTSGTTSGVRGKHYHVDTDIYDLSMTTFFKSMVMRGSAAMRMGVLFPHEKHMPNSSLAHYLTVGAREFGLGDTHFYICEDAIDTALLQKDLEAAIADGAPFLLLGATYGLARVMDEWDAAGIRMVLPKGSVIFDTGGFKSYKTDMTMPEFYERLTTTFGVSAQDCINMYGMTELSSEYYDRGNALQPSIKVGPPWMRTRIIDPHTGEEVPDGTEGVIVHYDLANYNSVCALMTEDLGVKQSDGFALLGRVSGSAAKGCSLTLEHFLEAMQGE